ncbi:uncharacterized protein LOC113782049 [Coffea eugenioides]|uniref:Reverse transcriptase domain-containing protein n=1 Tax=Coffea arabica TaxID=13443 RepID=A0ABM4VQU7_COFAR|nr:uncharacterized protein LOC113782049 [Coffea eugenioides]
MGDFNDICSNGEKWGGRERFEGSFRDFNNFIFRKELVDIGFVGVPWTWSNTWDEEGEVKERLDRCLGSVGWMQLYENVTCEHIEKRHLITASLWWTRTRNKGEVKEGFSSTKDEQKTKHLKWTAKGNAKAKIQEIKEQLKVTREADERCNKGVITTLKLQLSKAYKDEELYWSQKSRSRWLKEGDKNTAYFHQSVMAKRKRNRISILQKTDGEWCRSDQEIEDELCTHYKELFTSNNPIEFDEVLQGIPRTISNLMNAQLIKPVDELEIKQAIFSMFPNKFSGVDGRQILDNVIIAHELLHFLKSKRSGKVGFMTIKLDMSKAYDRVKWKFLGRIMMHMGFCPTFVQWIMTCISTVSYFFNLNGQKVGCVKPSRGIRQGDPLSPYLFIIIICTEGLSNLLKKAVDNKHLTGIKICKDSPMVSHLFFADDSLLCCKASKQEAQKINEIIQLYGQATG